MAQCVKENKEAERHVSSWWWGTMVRARARLKGANQLTNPTCMYQGVSKYRRNVHGLNDPHNQPAKGQLKAV